MPAHKSRWSEEYGPVHKVTYRLPVRVKDIIEAAATELGITATDAVIEAVLQTYANRRTYLMATYNGLTDECQRHDCSRTVWVIEISGGKRVRVQTPYCEMHAREFSDMLDDEGRYGR